MLSKVTVSKVMEDLYGMPFASPRSTQETGAIKLTAAEVFIAALLAPVQSYASFEEHEAKVNLAERIKDAEECVDLSDEEIELLKDLVPRTNNLPLIVSRAIGALQEKEGN